MLKSTLVIATCLATAGMAQAEGLKGKPGKWETAITSSMKMTMGGGMSMDLPSNTITTTSCMAEDETFNPDDLTMEGCEISNLKEGPRSMSFTMTCNQGGVSLIGDMSYEISAAGDAGKGTMTLNGEMPGQGTMEMKGSTVSKWIGPCTED